jgi:adenylate kinase family enzyme
MTRVAVIGNAGGGKSTLCRAFSAAHGLPLHTIDAIQWRPGWEMVPEADYDRAHDAILDEARWIIDGVGTLASVERRLAAADTIVFVDHPILLHYWWATKRQFKALFADRPDGPEGYPMVPVTFRLYRMMWWLHSELRPKLVETIEKHRSSARVVHICSPRELRSFAQSPV